MAAITKTFYGNSNVQKVKTKLVTGLTEVEVSASPGLLWGFSGDASSAGKITDDATEIAYVSGNSVFFNKPVPFETSLKVTLTAGNAVVYYE